MEDYFEFISQGLLLKLGQVREFIKKHNPTIGILTEEILREFLKEHLPNHVSVEQGFIRNKNGETSRQCDIIIYDSSLYSPFYRINDIVIVPDDSVIAVIEIKTTINSKIFHSCLDYFRELKKICYKPAHLFIYNSKDIDKIESYFVSYRKIHGAYTYDHDTFDLLPNMITGINSSFHLQQDYVISERDTKGYSSFFFKNQKGTEINAIQQFYLALYSEVEQYLENTNQIKLPSKREEYFKRKQLSRFMAIELFDI